ncbi:unnamed protein product [Bursaphelenchus okinawaensis]|uniref:Chloride channel protein n=1 Tax=Bursaphelenchus okinawaensis TaxID=465554 RepID=A0A811LPU0_9BILA|nr:unnamed protein product [Bursaphelenchus okinawaensis]CAG9125942.1 unnamed protein product [Bursaphelenchus okinawaensis]
MHRGRRDDERRLLPPIDPNSMVRRQVSFSRIPSMSSLDPNEDPASGLERVSSISSMQNHQRRREREKRLRIQQQIRRNEMPETSVHTLSDVYESLDYEVVDNELYRNEEASKDHDRNLRLTSRNRWLACLLIGIAIGLIGVVVDIAVYYSSKLKYHIIINGLVDICESGGIGNGGCMWLVLTAWASYNCILVALASLMVVTVSGCAAGSGIPLIKCFLNGVQIPGVVTVKTLLAKVVGVACSVAGGLAVGKEGPMIHSGAAAAALIPQIRFTIFGREFDIFRSFRNDREKRDFVSAGAAAGVSAAFAAPIGGVLFSLEEGASFWNQSMTWRMVFTALVSTFTLNCFLSFFYGLPGYLSWSGLANFGVFENKSYNVWEVPFFAAIGALGGLSGALFNCLNCKLTLFRKNYIRNPYQKFFECLLVAAASAFVGFITLLLVDDCQPIGVNPGLTDVTKLWCPRGKYSAVANLFFQNPEESVKSLFHSPFNALRPMTLLVFAVQYFFMTCWVYGLALPGGVFIPLLLTGAAWGRLIGLGVESVFPTMAGIDPGKYALAGAAAQLGGVVRMTISLTAIIMEATKDITFVMPIMITLWAAKFVGDYFNEGIYDSNIEQLEIPLLGWHPPKLGRNILTQNIMRKDVVALQPKERVGHILDILKSTKHHAFPVVDKIEAGVTEAQFPDYGRLMGLILRSQLFALLKKRHFTIDVEGRHPVPGAEPICLSDFNKECSSSETPLHELNISGEDERAWMSFRPFIHQSPHRVPVNASLGSIYKLFRGLGLRHIFVVNDDNRMFLLFLLPLTALAWNVPLDLQVAGRSFNEFGTITVEKDHEGNYTGFFRSRFPVSRIEDTLLNNLEAAYKIKADSVWSSNTVCLMLKANLQHEFHVTIDGLRNKVLSLTVFPSSLHSVGKTECAQEEFKGQLPSVIEGKVLVTSVSGLPAPDVATYVKRMAEEKAARQHGAAQDNRSFLAKYWMYIVPAVIFLLITNAVGADQPSE